MRWLLGTVLILAGMGWMALVAFGSMMADREVDQLDEVVKPCLLGLAPIVLGVLCFFISW